MAPPSIGQIRSHPSNSSIPQVNPVSPRQSLFSGFKVSSPRPVQIIVTQSSEAIAILEGSQSQEEPLPISPRKSLKRALSSHISRVGSVLRGQSSPTCESPLESPIFAEVNTSSPSEIHASSMLSGDVAGPRFQPSPQVEPIGERTAGDPAVYSTITVCFRLDMFLVLRMNCELAATFILGLRHDSRTCLNQRCGQTFGA